METIRIKVKTSTIIELMLAIDERIKQNKEWIKRCEKDGLDELYKDTIKKNKDLRKIQRALKGIKPILIEEV